jgi:hypothetical protein
MPIVASLLHARCPLARASASALNTTSQTTLVFEAYQESIASNEITALKRNNLETMMVNTVTNAKLHIAKPKADISRRKFGGAGRRI